MGQHGLRSIVSGSSGSDHNTTRREFVDRKKNDGTLTLLVSEIVGESRGNGRLGARSSGSSTRAKTNCVANSSVSLPALHHRIPGSHERGRRGVADAGGSGLRRPGGGAWSRNVLYRVPSPGNSGRIDCRALERTPMDRTHHDYVGNRDGTDGLHSHIPRFLRGSSSGRRGGSRFLPRDYRLYFSLVQGIRSREGGGQFLRREPALVRHRLPTRRLAAGHLVVGASRGGVGVHIGGTPGDRVGHHYHVLPVRLAAPSQLAAGGRARLDHSRAGAGEAGETKDSFVHDLAGASPA